MLTVRFDRGTIVVVRAPRTVVVERLPAFVLDARDGRYRAPAAAFATVRRACAEQNVPVTIEDRPTARSIQAIDVPALRDYQVAAVAAWDLANRQGVVVLPTGSGKTRVAIAAIARAGRPTLCVVPTRVLLHQWVDSLSAAGYDDVGRLGDGESSVRPITVATFESAYRSMAKIGAVFDLLVVDEVHHFGLGVRDELLAMSIAPLRLGLTATPRSVADSLGREVADATPYVGPVVYSVSLSSLVGVHLAPFERVVLPISLDPEESRDYAASARLFSDARRSVVAAGGACTFAELVATLGRSEGGQRALVAWARTRRIVAWCRAKRDVLGRLLVRHDRDRVLVFTANAEVALLVAREMLVHPITADVGRAERGAVLDRFREGAIRAIVSAQVLNEGLDVPDADVAIVLGGRGGTREHVQRVGRVLRPAVGKRAVVYEVVCRGTHEVAQATRRRSALGR